MNADEIAASRESHSSDPKSDAGLKFTQQIVVQRGEVSDAAFDAVREAGFTDGDISEIVANVALNIFANYFNHVAQTDVDSPPVSVEIQ
jgi:alkylhydroperoxidase family enzyme